MSTDWVWPDGAKVAVSLTFDVDAESSVLGRDESNARRLTSLSEGRFGITRGMPRILELLRRYELPATFFVPGYTAEAHPGAVADLLGAGHEVGHHGYLHLRSDRVSKAEQREEIERGLASLESAGAPRPVGYRSTSWEITPETFGLLIEHGFDYDSSCMGDDRPYFESHADQRILELPVHWSLDDWPHFGWGIDRGGNLTEPAAVFSSWASEYEAARSEGRHVTYTMHPEVIGRAYRFVQLEALVRRLVEDGDVWFARLDDVARHVRPRLEAA
jgi:peptidoglycan/xylan/chitin deacetylase (PgdA/CDA1 family)